MFVVIVVDDGILPSSSKIALKNVTVHLLG